jgi:hypothetical protein
VPTRRLVAAGLLLLVAVALAPAPAGDAATVPDDFHLTGDVLAGSTDGTPAVVADIRPVDWRPAHRSTRVPVPIVLVSVLGGAALFAGARAQLQRGPHDRDRSMQGRSWRGRAPPVRFSPMP